MLVLFMALIEVSESTAYELVFEDSIFFRVAQNTIIIEDAVDDYNLKNTLLHY